MSNRLLWQVGVTLAEDWSGPADALPQVAARVERHPGTRIIASGDDTAIVIETSSFDAAQRFVAELRHQAELASVPVTIAAIRQASEPLEPPATSDWRQNLKLTRREKENLKLTAAVLWVVVLGLAAAVGGALAHAYFAPKEDACNSIGGGYAQQADNDVLFGCGLTSFLSQMSTIIQWLGILVLAFMALLAIYAAFTAATRRRTT